MCSDAATNFVECIDSLGCIRKTKEVIGIKDIVVWIGAGFSKAWDEHFPSGAELFNFGELASPKLDSFPNLREYLHSVFPWSLNQSIDFNFIKMLNYRLAVQQVYPEIQNKYMDLQLASKIQNELALVVFQRLRPLLSNKIDSKRKENIHRFINYLSEQSTYTAKGGAGFRTNFISTNYDFCIESALGLEDSDKELFLYRGFTPYEYNGLSHVNIVTTNSPHLSLYKLNGGFEIIEEPDGFSIDYRVDQLARYYCNCKIRKSLVLPNYEQNYSSKYFNMIFPKAVDLLKRSKLLLLVGTSIPEEDILFKHLLSHFAEQTEDYNKKYIFCITKGTKKSALDLHNKILDIFPQYKLVKDRVFVYRKGVDAFINEFVRHSQEIFPREYIWKNWYDS